MVAPIVKFLHSRGISLMAFMDNSINQARCMCKAIFHIHMIILVFRCCGWLINWVTTILELTKKHTHLSILRDTLRKTIALPEDKTTWVEAWAKKLLAVNKTT